MRTAFLACLLGIVGTGTAQVVFDLPNSIPSFGAQARELWYAPDDTSIVTTGLGVTWNFNFLQYADNLQKLVTSPSLTPYTADFPTATHAVGEIYLGASDTTWQYYSLAGTSLFHAGGTWPPPPNLLSCSDPIILATFPFSYGDLVEDDATCTITGGSPSTYLEGRELVATGTINYPGGTIPNVALIRRYWNAVALDEYEWFTTDDILAPVGQFQYGTLTIMAPMITSIHPSNAGAPLRTFPNPASSELFVEIENGVSQERCSYRLVNATGGIEQSGDLVFSGNKARLDVSDLASGNYLLRALSSSATWYAQVSIVR